MTSSHSMPVHGRAGRPIEVLHLIETLGLGGAEMTLYTLLKYLDPSRVRSRVVTFFSMDGSHDRLRTHFVPLVESMGIPVTSLGARRVREFPSAIQRLRQELQASRPDLVHTQLFAANIVGRVAGRLARVPVVSTIQSLDYEPERLATYTNPGNVIRVAAMLYADKYTARFCSRMIVPVSEAVAASTRRWLQVPPERMRVMYNPIDTGNFSAPDPDARRRIRERLGIPPDARIVLNVGRIMYAKGQIDLVNAMPAIIASAPNAHMVILGDVANKVCKAALDAAIAAHGIAGHCHFPGASNAVREWLDACDVFVFPSIFEGMGIAMAEAMLCGRPVVAASIVTLAEQIRDGVTGLLVPPQDPAGLARAVVRVLQDPALARRLGEAAERQAIQSYDPIRYAERMTAIYDHVLDRQGE